VRKAPLLIGFAAFLGLAATAARGDEPLPASIPDLLGARALAMSAYRGIAAGNDGIFTNAASLAARRRYAIETLWFVDRAGNDTSMQVLGGSVVDSETTSVTGGFSYNRVLSGPWQGNLFHLVVAFPLSQGFYLGGTAKYQSLDGPGGDHMGAANADASAFWQAGSLIAIGVSGYNLVSAGHKQLQPRQLGGGISIGDERRFHLAGDVRADFDRQPKTTYLYAVGGELLLGDLVPVRAGFMDDETRNGTFFSLGAGIVLSNGIAIDVAYRQSIERSSDRTISAALKLFVFSG
jgi:hypothetical protein